MKYNKETINIICTYIREGDSQKVAAAKAGVSETQFYKWKQERAEFAESIKTAKDEFLSTIVGKLETSLYKRAMGFEVTETETERTSDSDGNPRIKKQVVKKKYVAPDTAALIFALSNLCPERWVNRQRTEVQPSKELDDEARRYNFEDLPENVINEMADMLQDIEREKIEKEKNGEK